ncbi:MAG: RDD family protein, partial [Vicinamibacterales bacterium]
GETPALDRLGFVDLQTDAPAEPAPLADLPLADPPPSDLFASPPPARPPLAVRRTAERPRSRPATQIVRRSPAGLLDVEVSPPEASPAEPVAVTSTGAASIPARLGAGLIDVALLAGIALVVVYFTVRLAGLTMAEVGSLPLPPLAAFLLGLAVAYLAAFTACGGQTLGKMAAGLRVVAEDGAVPPGTAALRAVAALAGGALAGLGFLPALFDAEHRGVHDRLTGTRVVRG